MQSQGPPFRDRITERRGVTAPTAKLLGIRMRGHGRKIDRSDTSGETGQHRSEEIPWLTQRWDTVRRCIRVRDDLGSGLGEGTSYHH
jgi:hypothetical protein